jgi:hypothetical protein
MKLPTGVSSQANSAGLNRVVTKIVVRGDRSSGRSGLGPVMGCRCVGVSMTGAWSEPIRSAVSGLPNRELRIGAACWQALTLMNGLVAIFIHLGKHTERVFLELIYVDFV